MLITVSISNKSYWVPTWKMLSEFAKKSQTSTTKMAKTNPDGTVSAEIDYSLMHDLIAKIADHNLAHEGQNTLTVVLSADDYEDQQKATA